MDIIDSIQLYEQINSSQHHSICSGLWVCVTVGGLVCLTAPPGSLATVANTSTTTTTSTEQSFQVSCSSVTVAGQIFTAKLPLPTNNKMVAVNLPTNQGGTEHQSHPFLLQLPFPTWMNSRHLPSDQCFL